MSVIRWLMWSIILRCLQLVLAFYSHPTWVCWFIVISLSQFQNDHIKQRLLWLFFLPMSFCFQNQSTADEVSCIGNVHFYKGNNGDTYQMAPHHQETYQIAPTPTFSQSYQHQHLCNSCQIAVGDPNQGFCDVHDDLLYSKIIW